MIIFQLCLIMDFDGGSWDIAVDAESLHKSLFGNLSSHDNVSCSETIL